MLAPEILLDESERAFSAGLVKADGGFY